MVKKLVWWFLFAFVLSLKMAFLAFLMSSDLGVETDDVRKLTLGAFTAGFLICGAATYSNTSRAALLWIAVPLICAIIGWLCGTFFRSVAEAYSFAEAYRKILPGACAVSLASLGLLMLSKEKR